MTAPDPRELVKLLRRLADQLETPHGERTQDGEMLREAAAALTVALDRAEDEASRAAVLEEARDNWRVSEYSERQRAERAEARMKELEEALRDIYEMRDATGERPYDLIAVVKQKARSALGDGDD